MLICFSVISFNKLFLYASGDREGCRLWGHKELEHNLVSKQQQHILWNATANPQDIIEHYQLKI